MRSSKPYKRGSHIWLGLAFSLILHLLGIGSMLLKHAPAHNQEEVFDVALAFDEPARQQSREQAMQIVSPPDSSAATPPVDTNKLSEIDSYAPKEQLRRGDGGGEVGGTQNGSQNQSHSKQKESSKAAPQSPESPESPESKKSLPLKETQKESQPEKIEPKHEEPKTKTDKNSTTPHKLANLRLDSSTLLEKFGEIQKAPEDQSESQSQSNKPTSSQAKSQNSSLSEYRAFSRPPGSGAAFLGNAGTNDFMPNLPDGDITLLNAKASTYAGFVRRVATQVFSQLRVRGWEKLSSNEIRQMVNFTTVEAVMSRTGALLGVTIVEGSGSASFDGVLIEAAKAGTRDPNPPAGSEASDGNIHFIFKARSWSSSGTNPRNGGFLERRWLLLATGLE